MAGLLFNSNGLLATFQDAGRCGFRKLGVNPGGAMDARAARLINILLDNDESEAVLEMHFPSPKLAFDSAATFALGGADFGARLDDKIAPNWQPCFAQKGSSLSFSGRKFGARCYLAVRGGFKLTPVLGSYSTNLKAGFGGLNGQALGKGDKVDLRSEATVNDRVFGFSVSPTLLPFYSAFPTVRVIAGAEFELLTRQAEDRFFTQDYEIGVDSDRMGFRLKGEPLRLGKKLEMVSAAVDFGTVQLLPDGQLIVLMADHQTTGGYPRIAHVISEDLPLLAQLNAKDKVAFHQVSIAEAEQLLVRTERDLNLLRLAVKGKWA